MATFDDYLQGAPSVDELDVTAQPQVAASDPGLQTVPTSDITLSGPQGPVPTTPPPTQGMQMPGVNYNNTQSADAVKSALGGEGSPQGGMANPGLYGLLPQGLQHGTLRNMLGALGDAFLVGSGRQAQYEPRMQRQEIGQAMAGYDPSNPQAAQAAIQRIASTGAAGSPEMADQLQKSQNEAQMRSAMMQQTQMYHQQTIQARNDNLFNRMSPVAQADLAQAKDPADYAARLSRWDQRTKAIDPNTDAATQFGVPDTFTPGALTSTSGMSANQIAQSTDRAASRAQAGRDTDVNAQSRVQAAGMGNQSRNYATNVGASKPTSAGILQGLIDKDNANKAGNGPPLTPAEQAAFTHMTSNGKQRAQLPAGLQPGGQGGNSRPQPTAADRAYVQSHPETRGAFQAHFGVSP
jgi:hypothetical protein